MRCLIRHINHYGRSGKVYQDKLIEKDSISIGRSAEQDLFLPDLRVALQHAIISKLPNGQFLLQARTLSGIRVNERLSQSANLTIGDTIRIGHSQIKIQALPTQNQQQNIDLMLEVNSDANKDKTAHQQTLNQINKNNDSHQIRRWSWLLFVGILVLFLLIPLIGRYMDDYYQPILDDIEEWLATDEKSPNLPKLPTIISDRFWNSGTMASAHHFFQQECDTCHQKAFEKVPNTACLACHKKTYHHVDPEFFDLDELTDSPCSNCHAEHNGKKQLIQRDDKLCSQCHQDLSLTKKVESSLSAVSNFEHDHPEFKPTLIGYDTETQQKTSNRNLDVWDENIKENSRLSFSHQHHISRKGLETIDGIKRLWCDDCHIQAPNQPHFNPISFDTHCQECHQLSFEPTDPFRFLPHGQPAEIMLIIQAYYARRALEGNYLGGGNAPDIVIQGSFPAEKIDSNDLMIALDWAKEKSAAVIDEVFEFSLCVQCHDIEQTPTDATLWHIIPVQINQNFLPKAQFNHNKHLTSTCVTCHLVNESENSSDVLLPNINICRQCHGGIDSKDKLQSTCVDCHHFHIATEFTMRATADLKKNKTIEQMVE